MKRAAVDDVVWPSASLGQALGELAREIGLSPRLVSPPTPPTEALADASLLDRWIESAAEYFGFEAESVSSTFAAIGDAILRAAPALVRVPDPGGGFRVVLVVASSPNRIVALAPGLVRRAIDPREIAAALRSGMEKRVAPVVERWTSGLPLSMRRRSRAREALLFEIAGDVAISGIWLLRPRPGAKFSGQLRHSGDVGRLVLFLGMSVAQITLSLLGWSSLFDGAVTGRLETSSLARWTLLSLTSALLELTRSFVVGRINVSVASLLKRRVLAGAMKLDPGAVRARGSGGILALISEAEVLETSGLAALLGGVSALVSLVSAIFVLARGAGGAWHVALLAIWSIVVAGAMVGLAKRTRAWVDFRLRMTNGLVERMVGHRTRMAQEKPEGRHAHEDAELELYLGQSRAMDGFVRIVQGLPARGWLVLGFAALLPALFRGAADPGSLLVAIGGLFVAQSAFASISSSVTSVLDMSVAWQRAGDLFRAAAKEEAHGLPAAAVQEMGPRRSQSEERGSVLEARKISFRYREGAPPILRGASLRLERGDRVLVEGSSGGGKSTFASLLAGLRDPDAGLVLHHGIDRATLGTTTWRRKIATVPQFHENHILTGSLLFNLLLGRRWPASADDRRLAREVCESLGLGPLLARMPAGLEQIVGETGWQLSHGERTRVFLARALLQGAEVVLVDESFGALDPDTLRVAVDATWARAPTLLVIAHP